MRNRAQYKQLKNFAAREVVSALLAATRRLCAAERFRRRVISTCCEVFWRAEQRKLPGKKIKTSAPLRKSFALRLTAFYIALS